MNEPPTPPGGFRMVLALTDLANAQHEQLVAEYLKSLPVMRWSWLDDARAELWSGLVARACRGEIEFRGVRDGDTEPRAIHPGLLRGSKPDFLADRLEASGAVYYAVSVFPAPAGAALSATVSATNRCAYSDEALSAWFVLRVHSWPAGAPPPDEKADLSAAGLFFDSLPGRDDFRRIRQSKTPAEWRKTGPRRAQ